MSIAYIYYYSLKITNYLGNNGCSGEVWWSARSKLRLLCLPGGVPQKAHQV